MSDQRDQLFQLLGLNPESSREKAFTQGLLGSIFQAAALSGPQPRPVSTAQALGQVGLAGMGAYESSFDKTLREALTGLQVKDLIRKQTESEQLRTLLPQVFKTTRGPSTTEMIPSEQGDDVLTRQGAVTGVSIDPAKLQALMMIPGGAEAVKGLAETQKLVRQAGLGGAGGEMPSPFAAYLKAQSPNVRELAKTYDAGFKAGRIDEDTADKRIIDLARMEETFISRRTEVEGREAAREEKRLQGTEGQNLSAGFASRMVASNAIISELENLQTGSLAQVLPTEKTQTAAGVPLFGGYLQRKVMTPEQQQYKQAADNWIRANLRKESGAAIPPEEMRLEYETYFPLPGESAETIEQKRNARELTTRAMIQNAGPVYKPVDIKTLPSILSIKKRFNLE